MAEIINVINKATKMLEMAMWFLSIYNIVVIRRLVMKISMCALLTWVEKGNGRTYLWEIGVRKKKRLRKEYMKEKSWELLI